MPVDLPRYTLRVPRGILDKIAVIAENNDRSTNKEIERLLKKYIDEYEKNNGEIVIRK